MHADNSTHLIAAARRRHEDARQRVVDALRAARAADRRPSVSALAATARVSRSFLYANPDLIQALQGLGPNEPTRTKARRQASEHSLLTRVAALTEKNKTLRNENVDLRRRLEAAHGALRDQQRQPMRTTAS